MIAKLFGETHKAFNNSGRFSWWIITVSIDFNFNGNHIQIIIILKYILRLQPMPPPICYGIV